MVKRLLGQSVLYALGDLLGKGAAFVLIPLYTRLLSPDDYGVLALVGTISSIVLPLITFGARGAVHRFYFQFDDDLARRKFYGSLWLFFMLVPAAILLFFDLIAVRFPGDEFFGVKYHPYISLSLWTAYLSLATVTFLLLIVRASEKALYSSLLSLAAFLLPTILTILFVMNWIEGVEGVLWGRAVGTVLVSLAAAIFILKYVKLNFHLSHWCTALAYSAPLIVHFIAQWVLASSDRLVLQRYTSLAEVGIYSVGYQIGSGAVYIAQGGYNAILPVFGKLNSSTSSDGANLARVITYYVFAVTLVVLSIIVFSPEVVKIMVAPSYSSAADVVPWIALGVLFMCLYFLPAGTLTHIIGDPKWIALGTVGTGLLNIGLNLVFVPIAGAMAAAISTAVSYLGLLLFVFCMANRQYVLPYEFGRLFKIFLAASVVCLASRVLTVENLWLSLVVKAAMLSVILPLVLYMVGFFTEEEKSWLRRVRKKAVRHI